MDTRDSAGIRPVTLWVAASTVAGLGTWVMFDSLPGINWAIWTMVAAAALLVFVRRRSSSLIALTVSAVIIAAGAAVTADPFMTVLIVFGVMLYLAMAMLVSPDPARSRIDAWFTVTAPVVAFASAITESARRAIDALHLVRSSRARSVLRGIAMTLPVLVIFTVLLASADPVFAAWRDAIRDLLSSWAFVPRTVFFIALLVIVLGAYGYADRGEPPALSSRTEPAQWLGATEQLILLGGIALLLWIFMIVQVSYLFGNVAGVRGSGMTFAEYARRGFAEMTIVASTSVFLIILAERYGSEERRALTRTVTVALIVALLFLLGSAFNRVLLYEQAYGFTTARLYAQFYMGVVTLALLDLALQMRSGLDTAKLFRRVTVVATAALIVLIYWNHEAWIAGRNIDRLRETGKLDNSYLTKDLSLNAVPTLVRRLPAIPEPVRSSLRNSLISRYRGRRRMFETRWFEWNLRRNEAHRALDDLGIPGLLDAPGTSG